MSDAAAAERRLKAAQARKRRKALGPPLDLSDEALDQAAEITPADTESALAFWRVSAPPGARNLLDAEPDLSLS